MLEKIIQNKVVQYARSKCMLCYKMGGQGCAVGTPDYLFLTAGGDIFFCEFKQLGKKPTAMQLREHVRLRLNNIKVYLVDSVEYGKGIIDENS